MSDRQARKVGDGLCFTKMHGAGNDFVVIDLRDGRASPSATICRQIADRHTGVGYDQLLTIERPRSVGAVASYRIWNADGSQAQQCGNGARCVAAWLVRDGSATGSRFVLDSPAGTHAVDVEGDGHFSIAMGVPGFNPRDIPMRGIDAELDVYARVFEGREVRFSAVTMGNPHAVIEVDDVDDAPVGEAGPALQGDALFPESVNVGFAQVVARDHVRLRVHERGAGETLACGSGACAAAAALMRRGRVDRSVTVSLPGGDLRINWPDDAASITMSGPTAFVFEGEWLQ